jgi:hypothetical protein
MADDGMVLGGGIFLVVGLIMLALGLFLLVRTLRFLRTAVETTGTIVDFRGSGDEFQRVVEFKTHEGKTIRWTERSASGQQGHVGDEIPMKYNPEKPNQARISRTSDLWLGSGALSLSGLGFAGVGLVLVILGA